MEPLEKVVGWENLVSESFEEINIEDGWGNIGGDKVDFITSLI